MAVIRLAQPASYGVVVYVNGGEANNDAAQPFN